MLTAHIYARDAENCFEMKFEGLETRQSRFVVLLITLADLSRPAISATSGRVITPEEYRFGVQIQRCFGLLIVMRKKEYTYMLLTRMELRF